MRLRNFVCVLSIALGFASINLQAAEPAKPATAEPAKPATGAATPAAAASTTAAPAAPVAPPPPVFVRTALPTRHAYQKTLRDYLATLKESDFDHGVEKGLSKVEVELDAETQYRTHIFTLLPQPLIGSKRGLPAVNCPPSRFTLAELETPEGVMRPPLWSEPVGQLVSWNYPGNPFYQSKAMKLRAFVVMCVNLMMIDEQHEFSPEIGGGGRTDWLHATMLVVAQPYQAVHDVLPPDVQKAYLVGLKKLGERMLDWGPKGEEVQLDVGMPVALWYMSQAIGDPAFTAKVESYAKGLYTDPNIVHPAGYFIDRGGLDLGFAGQANYYAAWLALASKWSFVKDVVERNYRLRAHLSLPDPDGRTYGPSQFHTRFSGEIWRDQWEWGAYRDTAISLVTDEAAYLWPVPAAELLASAADRRVSEWNRQISENPIHKGVGFIKNDAIRNSPWKFSIWQTYNFPTMTNWGWLHYPQGALAHRRELEKNNSPLLKSPFLRDEHFVRDFAKAFTVAKNAKYAAIVHSGPVAGETLDDSYAVLPGPYGFGGGQLSAFWTPSTGSVILGRRGGQSWDKTFDVIEDWQKWPIHAVSGSRADGKIFSTSRIRVPDVTSELTKDGGVVRVSGMIPKGMLGQNKVLEGRLDYARSFTIAPESLTVETTIKSSGQDTLSELYETLPVFLREGVKMPATSIEFRSGKDWVAASGEWFDNAKGVRLKRFDGAVEIEFDRPRRIKLSASDWADTFITRVSCRNILIDLLESGDQPKVLRDARVKYTLKAATR